MGLIALRVLTSLGVGLGTVLAAAVAGFFESTAASPAPEGIPTLAWGVITAGLTAAAGWIMRRFGSKTPTPLEPEEPLSARSGKRP
jgi:Na+-transporting NADH:ubiquinone oxidoreductase subunit NqrE